jgi:hypothetical protein
MNLRTILLGKEKAYKSVVKRAIEDSLDQKKRIRSQDKAVYDFIESIYENRELIRKRYKAYQRLRDYQLKKK